MTFFSSWAYGPLDQFFYFSFAFFTIYFSLILKIVLILAVVSGWMDSARNREHEEIRAKRGKRVEIQGEEAEQALRQANSVSSSKT